MDFSTVLYNRIPNKNSDIILIDDWVTELFTFNNADSIKETIKEIIFNEPATIIRWKDGTKTVVKAQNEPYDKEKGMAMAIVKHLCGNKGNFNELFKSFIKEDGEIKKNKKIKKNVRLQETK